eukprot:gb/GFBE01032873.1/.p1 GENE.gb/GFBE01032873.1/~~gb/GFBE01032873.1/.p1  ORF type:complete len:316 (+),score=42.63 gb/GFBE01032873.1/:1-948(+)
MATRAFVEASIDSFWSAAGVARPATPQDIKRKHRPPHAKPTAGYSTAVAKLPPSLPGPGDKSFSGPGASGGRRQGYVSSSAGPPRDRVSEAELEDLKQVTVQLQGRDGYNAAAVNGEWRFWKVKNGRLGFRREVVVEVQEEDDADVVDAEDGYEKAPEEAPRAGGDGNGPELTVAQPALRLFLMYMTQTDAWVISDSPDASGSVIADCGPVGKGGTDLGQNWRVWDGTGWKEDRNITAEIASPGGMPSRLAGLRVVPPGAAQTAPLSARARTHSQEPRAGYEQRAPLSARTPTTARPDFYRTLSPRPLDSATSMI